MKIKTKITHSSESAGLELIRDTGDKSSHVLSSNGVWKRKHTLLESSSSLTGCKQPGFPESTAVKPTVIGTWLLQRLRVPHQPCHSLGVPVEDLHGQVVVLLLLHYSLLKLLLVTQDSPSTPRSRKAAVDTVTRTSHMTVSCSGRLSTFTKSSSSDL